MKNELSLLKKSRVSFRPELGEKPSRHSFNLRTPLHYDHCRHLPAYVLPSHQKENPHSCCHHPAHAKQKTRLAAFSQHIPYLLEVNRCFVFLIVIKSHIFNLWIFGFLLGSSWDLEFLIGSQSDDCSDPHLSHLSFIHYVDVRANVKLSLRYYERISALRPDMRLDCLFMGSKTGLVSQLHVYIAQTKVL